MQNSPFERNNLILVNPSDEIIGTAEKLAAHREGLLHRAFSVVLFNQAGEILLQQRAQGKYHSAGLWTNTCCSHPQPGDDMIVSAGERLFEEMGIRTTLHYAGKFHYTAALDGGLTENEIDYVFTGVYDGDAAPSPEEVDDWKWIASDDLLTAIHNRPEAFTYWLPKVLELALPAQQATSQL